VDTLFDSLPIGAYRSRPDGRLLRANLSLARINGFTTLAALYDAVRDIEREWYVDTERRAQFRQCLERDGAVQGFVSKVRRYATGEQAWVSENAHVVREKDGQVAYYEGTVEDITERVDAQAAVERNERQLREIAEHIPGMAYRVHMPNNDSLLAHYSFVSVGVRALYGVDPEAVLADARLLRRFRHPDDVARVDAEVRAALDKGESLTAAFRIVIDGQTKWVQMSSSKLNTENGEQVRVGVMLDVTQQHQAELLRSERDRAESERRHMTQFLSRVSHELRTPLNAILGFAQLIEIDAATPPHQRDWVHTLLDSGRHLLDLVDDVLDLTGAQSGQMAVDLAAVDLAPVLREAWRMVGAEANGRGLQFGGVPIADGQLQVQADRRRLLQVLVNLLSNAVKYNRPGGPVSLELERHDGSVDVTVVDGGPGMSEEQMARLFSPFDRLGAQRGLVPGTGLGLTLSRQLAQAMGGQLNARCEPDQGCRFTLSLPAA
jgi:PAS domain S-box-containing protein